MVIIIEAINKINFLVVTIAIIATITIIATTTT
jgi:hypothetical protein